VQTASDVSAKVDARTSYGAPIDPHPVLRVRPLPSEDRAPTSARACGVSVANTSLPSRRWVP